MITKVDEHWITKATGVGRVQYWLSRANNNNGDLAGWEANCDGVCGGGGEEVGVLEFICGPAVTVW